VIESVSNRPSFAGYARPKAATAPVAADASFQDAAARAAAVKESATSVDDGAFVPGIQPRLAYELASRRQSVKPQGSTAVPTDLLWALTGPGRATDAPSGTP
jgi:hypothetical protein